MKEVYKPPYDLEKFPTVVQDIIAKESDYWPAVGIIRNYDADNVELWPTDWWQIIFSRGIGTGVKIYDLWFHGKSEVPDINHVSVVDTESLKIVAEVA
jgi:hypothetical protein